MSIHPDTFCRIRKRYGETRKKYFFFGEEEVIPTTKTFWVERNGIRHESSKWYTEAEFEELMSLQETTPVDTHITVGQSSWWIFQRRYYRTTDYVFDPEVMKGMISSYWDRLNRREERARSRANGEEPKRTRKRKPKNVKEPSDEPPADDCPYQVLDVAENADLKQIKKAYRQKIQAYHPDKVAGLGIELQKLAETMTKKINNAYEMLKAMHKP
jgi:hypothetical protein